MIALSHTLPDNSIRRFYLLTAAFALAGFVAVWIQQGVRAALAFLLGSAASFGNLVLFDFLSRAISPAPGESKPWHTRAFISRYLLLFAGGYAIVRLLDVPPLPVIFGMLASTAAVMTSSLIELVERLFSKSTTR